MESCLKLGIVAGRKMAFKNTVLHPLAIAFQNGGNLCAALLVGNIVGNNVQQEMAGTSGAKTIGRVSIDLSLIHISEPTRPY